MTDNKICITYLVQSQFVILKTMGHPALLFRTLAV